ncbi:MAG: GNAT family N-acetyltransferase [Bacillaceae bacterium]
MNPILIDFPTQFETERLIIRMPQPGDGKVVYDGIVASFNELKPWMPFAQEIPVLEQTEMNIRQAHANFLKREDLRLLVFLKETGEFVASSGLHRIDWDVRRFEIGYWIHSDYRKKGYMTEAVAGIVKFALDELQARRIEIRCDVENANSRAIPERLGFELDGILKQDSMSADGTRLTDTCIYSIIK